MQLYYILRPTIDFIRDNQDIAGLLGFTSIALIAFFTFQQQLAKRYEN